PHKLLLKPMTDQSECLPVYSRSPIAVDRHHRDFELHPQLVLPHHNSVFLQLCSASVFCYSFIQADDGIRAATVTGVQTCALPILAGTLQTCSSPANTWDCRPKNGSLSPAPWLTGDSTRAVARRRRTLPGTTTLGHCRGQPGY